MKRLAIVLSVISVALLVLGIVDYLNNRNVAGGVLFGNPKLPMNDGTTVLIAGSILILLSAGTWLLAAKRGQNDQRRS